MADTSTHTSAVDALHADVTTQILNLAHGTHAADDLLYDLTRLLTLAYDEGYDHAVRTGVALNAEIDAKLAGRTPADDEDDPEPTYCTTATTSDCTYGWAACPGHVKPLAEEAEEAAEARIAAFYG